MKRDHVLLALSFVSAWGSTILAMRLLAISPMAAIGLTVMYVLVGSAVVFVSGTIAGWIRRNWKGYGFVCGAVLMAALMAWRLLR
jgi:hypothetical protein